MNRRHAIIAYRRAPGGAAGTASADLAAAAFSAWSAERPAPPGLRLSRLAGRRVAHGAGLPADKTVRAIEAQLDLVGTPGLRPDVLARMRAAPIIVVAGDGARRRHYAHGGVLLDARRLDPKKPLALFGLLQAYAGSRPARAACQPRLDRFRREALAAHVWPKTALMLQSTGDFFAATAAVYLVGTTNREPYTRAHLRQTQPAYYQWLADLFDRGVRAASGGRGGGAARRRR